MKSLLVVLLISISLDAYAGAWLIDNDLTHVTESMGYAFTAKHKDFGRFDSGSYYRLSDNVSKYLHTNLIEYGVSNELSVFGEFDLQYIDEILDISIKHSTNEFQSQIPSSYIRFDSSLGFKHLFSQDNGSVLSGQLTLFPGDFQFSASGQTNHLKKMKAVEARVLYGKAFQFNNYYFNSSLWHFYDLQLATKYYPNARKLQLNLDASLGIRPSKNWLVSVGVYNTFHGYIQHSHPQAEQINFIIDNANILGEDKSNLKSLASNFIKAEHRYNSHKLQLKLAYDISSQQTLLLEGLSDVFCEKPGADSSIVLSLRKRF